jgi:MFS superfamily sulfate permease-like transporter
MFAQGLGNVIAGLVGALPVTAVIVRTSANVNAGSKTKMSTIFHGFWLLAFVLFAPQLINEIPLSALAAVLIFVGYKLAKPSLFIEQKKKGNIAFYPFVITILAILLTDLLIGISIGMLLGFYFVIKSNFHKSFSIVREENNVLIRFHHQATFLNKSVLKNKLITIQHGDSVLLDFTNCTFMDVDIVDILNDFLIHSRMNQIKVEMQFVSETQELTILKNLSTS